MKSVLIGVLTLAATTLVFVVGVVFAGLFYGVVAIPVFFAWKFVAVAAFSAPPLGFWQVFAACWGIGVLFSLIGRVRKAV
jgi:hypothetical protein